LLIVTAWFPINQNILKHSSSVQPKDDYCVSVNTIIPHPSKSIPILAELNHYRSPNNGKHCRNDRRDALHIGPNVRHKGRHPRHDRRHAMHKVSKKKYKKIRNLDRRVKFDPDYQLTDVCSNHEDIWVTIDNNDLCDK